MDVLETAIDHGTVGKQIPDDTVAATVTVVLVAVVAIGRSGHELVVLDHELRA